MRKWLWSLLLLAFAIPVHAQVSAPSVRYVVTAPSGACSPNPPIQVVISTGVPYTCNNGTWGAAGGGTGPACGTANIPCTNTANTFTQSQTLSNGSGVSLNLIGSDNWGVSSGGTAFGAGSLYFYDANTATIAAAMHGSALGVRQDGTIGIGPGNPTDALDTTFSRVSPGVFQVGSGASGNALGSMNMASLNAGTSVFTPALGNIYLVDGFQASSFGGIGLPQVTWTNVAYPLCRAVSNGGLNYISVAPTLGVTPGTNQDVWWPVQSSGTPTNVDCAFYYLLGQADVGGVAYALQFGNTDSFSTPYITNIGLAEPATAYHVSLLGMSRGVNGGPTELKYGGSGFVMVSSPDKSGSLPYNFQVSNLAMYGNNQSLGCLKIFGEKAAIIEHIYCTGWNPTSAFSIPITIGDGTAPFLNGGYQEVLDDIFVQGGGNGPASAAVVTVAASGGSPVFTVVSGGTYVNNSTHAFLWGFGNGQNPCTTTGTLTPVWSGTGPYTLTGVTASGFAGCTGTMYGYVPDISAAPYGIQLSLITDSTFKDLVVANAGWKYGIFYNGSSSNTMLHEHVYGASQTFILDNNENAHYGAEIDSGIQVGVEAGSSSGNSLWTDTQIVQGGGAAQNVGFSAFKMVNGGSIMQSTCGNNATSSNAFNLVIGFSGPIAHGGSFGNVNVIDGEECDTLTKETSFASKATAPSVADTGLTAGQCVQAGTGGLLASAASPCFTGTTYYVDSVGGLDSNSGLTPSLPWQTLAHVAAQTLNGNTAVLLKSGDTWREQFNIPNTWTAATPQSPIIFSSYGQGALPIISGADVLASGSFTSEAMTQRLPNVVCVTYSGPAGCPGFVSTAGSLIVVETWNSALNTVTLTDTKGNTWTADPVIKQQAGYGWISTFHTLNNGAGFDTFQPSATTGLYRTVVMEWTGAAASAVLDGTAQNNSQAAATSLTSGASSGSSGNTTDLVLGIFDGGGSSMAVGSGYTQLDNFAPGGTQLLTEYKIGAGNSNAAATQGSSSVWGGGVLTFKSATVAGNLYYIALGANPSQVFYNGTRLNLAASKAQMTTGTWWWDSGNSRVYIFDNPSGQTVEATARAYAIYANCSVDAYLVFNGLQTQEALTDNIYTCSGGPWTWENGVTQNSYGSGYRMDGAQANSLITNYQANYNGASGIEVYATPSLTISNSVAHDNAEIPFAVNGLLYNAGFKVDPGSATVNDNFTGLTAYNNGLGQWGIVTGSGIWPDTTGNGNVIQFSTAYNNNKMGIDLDADNYDIAQNNVVYGNGMAGIAAYADGNVSQTGNQILNNLSYGNGDNIVVIGPASGSAANGCVGNIVKGNNVYGATGQGSGSNGFELYAYFGCENPGANGTGNVYTYNNFGVQAANFIGWASATKYSTYATWETAAGNCGTAGCSNSITPVPVNNPVLTGSGSGLYKGYAVDTGSANAYAVTLGDTAYTGTVAGSFFFVKLVNASTASSTIAINGGTARTLKITNSGTTSSIGVQANGTYLAVDDGTNIQLSLFSFAGGNIGLPDANAVFFNTSTASKQFKFSGSSISASTVRTITIPDNTGTMEVNPTTTFTVAGCGTATSLSGGGLVGQFTGGSSTCTPVVTTGITAAHGYSCSVNDQTTSTAAFRQTANSTTAITFTAGGTVGAADVINFNCQQF